MDSEIIGKRRKPGPPERSIRNPADTDRPGSARLVGDIGRHAGFHGSFIPVFSHRFFVCKPLDEEGNDLNIPHGPVYFAGIAIYITLGSNRTQNHISCFTLAFNPDRRSSHEEKRFPDLVEFALAAY